MTPSYVPPYLTLACVVLLVVLVMFFPGASWTRETLVVVSLVAMGSLAVTIADIAFERRVGSLAPPTAHSCMPLRVHGNARGRSEGFGGHHGFRGIPKLEQVPKPEVLPPPWAAEPATAAHHHEEQKKGDDRGRVHVVPQSEGVVAPLVGGDAGVLRPKFGDGEGVGARHLGTWCGWSVVETKTKDVLSYLTLEQGDMSVDLWDDGQVFVHEEDGVRGMFWSGNES